MRLLNFAFTTKESKMLTYTVDSVTFEYEKQTQSLNCLANN